MSSAATDRKRLFLALWPDPELRRWLNNVNEQIPGGRKTPKENLHLTLIFLGDTAPAHQQRYQATLDDLVVPALELWLDRLGCWPHAGILWLGMQRPPAALNGLVMALNQRLAGCGFQLERRPFHPHITLARRFLPPPPPLRDIAQPFCWRSNTLVLVESIPLAQGTHYHIVHRWMGAGAVSSAPANG